MIRPTCSAPQTLSWLQPAAVPGRRAPAEVPGAQQVARRAM